MLIADLCPDEAMEHEQFELLVAAILTAAQLNQPRNDAPNAIDLLSKTLSDLRESKIIVKRNANFVPKGGR